ncbi:MAG: hypothetical protein Q4B50_05765, partial [Bacillota bacterium]|nr:hypothetical protein [Bacillota bacterium]
YEIGSVNLGGESFPSLRTSMRVNDILLFQEAVSMKCPGYIANLMFTAQEEETIDSLIGKFYLLR